MTTLLQFDSPFAGSWGGDLERACEDLATGIGAQPGLTWTL